MRREQRMERSRRTMGHFGWVVCGVWLFCGMNLQVMAGAPTPATQPAEGPGGAGGAEVKYKKVVGKSYGAGGQAYWIFLPGDVGKDKEAVVLPVIVFCHGWGALEPAPYGAWIDHLVQRGNIVIFPMYQASMVTPPEEFLPNTIAAVKSAKLELEKDTTRIRPDWEKLALAGHSVGGVLVANLAALSAKAQLPVPKAVLSVEPGKTWPKGTRATVKLEDLSQIPAGTLLLTVVGDSDKVVLEVDAKRIFKETTQIPAENKNYIRMRSDTHGVPELRASHYFPLASNGKYRLGPGAAPEKDEVTRDKQIRQCDTLDYYGTWKLLDGLTDTAFFGTNREYALGNTAQQRFMGKWSDGVAVRELEVVKNP